MWQFVIPNALLRRHYETRTRGWSSAFATGGLGLGFGGGLRVVDGMEVVLDVVSGVGLDQVDIWKIVQ
jgi:hypothetical protein